MGRFVEISIQPQVLDAAVASAVVCACPVDIFRIDAEQLATERSREDECILCGQCVALAPDAVSVTRAYGARRPLLATSEHHA